MSIKPIDRHFFIPFGAVMEDGGSLHLGRGQIGLFSVDDATPNGLAAYANLKGVPKTKKFVLKSGRGREDHSRTGNDKDFSTPHFSIDEVVSLNVSVPQRTEQKPDEVILGYDGIDPASTIDVNKGDNILINLRLTGDYIGYLGLGKEGVIIQEYISVLPCAPVNPSREGCAPCDPCESVSCVKPVEETIERLKIKRLTEGTKLGDVIEITPVNSCREEPGTTVGVNTYCIEVCDTGDSSAQMLLQNQYQGMKIVRVERKGSTSKYQTTGTALPADYNQAIASILKGCNDCPSSWTAVTGGYVYALTLEDDGADLSVVIEGVEGDVDVLPVAGLANVIEGTVIKSEGQTGGTGFYTALADNKLNKAEIAAFVNDNPTATVDYVGKAADICANDAVTTVSWTACGQCKTTTKDFIIDVPDNECGQDRLVELQGYYPELTIALEGTTGGCQRRYKTEVVTNVVCDECVPIFKDTYRAEAPRPFGDMEWKPAVSNPSSATDCLCGIRFKAKPMIIDPGEAFMDAVRYIESSVRIEVSGGYADMLPVENIDVYDNPVSVKYLSHWQPRSHVAGNMRMYEQIAHKYFTGDSRHHKPMSRALLNEETLLPEGSDQIVDYAFTIRPHRYTALSEMTYNTSTFHVITYFGYHNNVETLLNNIAAAAGIEPVRATATP
jgi:hypothetical protein